MVLNDQPSSSGGLANRVQEARLAKGWSGAELAKRAGISRQNLHLIERQTTQLPKPETMTALAEALNVDRAWLFYVVPTVPGTPDEQA